MEAPASTDAIQMASNFVLDQVAADGDTIRIAKK
jgi:hypothetical protein